MSLARQITRTRMVIRWNDAGFRRTIVMMSKDATNKKSIIGPAIDKFMGAVEWTKNRMVIVYYRVHAGKEYIRLRTFNRHQVKGCWYPAPRFYMVPLDRAAELGKAIIAASEGRTIGRQPEWWADFEKQYAGFAGRRTKAAPPDRSTVTVDAPSE